MVTHFVLECVRYNNILIPVSFVSDYNN
jgi:hypothetical protein